jgi:hypothetical protein
MATRFVRIDLSDDARDFRPIAVEPGLPLLDKSNSNAKILFRWLGGMVGEPVLTGDSVDFYVRDDHGGRLEDVICQTATRQDLESTLQEDLAALKDRIEKAKPETSTERALKRALQRSLNDLLDNPDRTDLDCYFFRYRDVQNRWRLVWCWGFQRVDNEPAPAIVCTDPECNLLFVRHPGTKPRCPSCSAALSTGPKKKRRLWPVALAALLLALIGGVLAAMYLWPAPLVATPTNWEGPAGSRVEFKVMKRNWIFWRKDVTRQAVAVVLDPRVARLTPTGDAAVAVNPGRTMVRFHLGNLKADATLQVKAAGNPERLLIEPANIELAVGSTARPKVVGQYKNGDKLDLTAVAEWVPQNDGVVFSMNGLLEGRGKGATSVAAKYRATRDDEYLEATAGVKVEKVDFDALEAAVEPDPVYVGRTSQLRIDAVTEEGKKYSVLESSLLGADVQPPYLAAVEGRLLKGRSAGHGKLAVTFAGDKTLTGGTEFEVAVGPGLDRLVVYPEKLEMVVGEITDLSIASPSAAPIQMTSFNKAVVEISKDNRLIGRRPGSTEVEVAQGDEKCTVKVEVLRVEFTSLAIKPSRLVVPVDDSSRAQVWATAKMDDGDRNVEIAPDLVVADKRPQPRFAEFEPRSLKLYGISPTEPSAPQTLALRMGSLKDSAPVEVIVPPFRLAISPPGEIKLPLGQQMRLQGWANYSGGRRVQIPAERMTWKSTPRSVPGVELRGEKVAALKVGAGPLAVQATYLREKSNSVTFNVVEPADVTLRLDVDRKLRLAGEPGVAVLSGTGPSGDVDLVPEMAKFESSEPKVLVIDEHSGGFQAATPGDVVITAKHDAAKSPASEKLRVYDPADVRMVFEPAKVDLAVNEVGRLQLFLEVQDGGKAERVVLAGPGVGIVISQPDAVRWYAPTLVGLQQAEKVDITASYAPYLSTTATARVNVGELIKPESIRIEPAEVELAAGQTCVFRVEQALPGRSGQYREVRPDAVSWTVPSGLAWTPPSPDLHPAAKVPQVAAGEYELQAKYGDQKAIALIKVKDAGPPSDAPLVLDREPGGEFLPVGHQQRYTILAEKGGAKEPVANVQWPDNFENDYVRWEAPVLTAKKAGYQQWLRAQVGERTVLFRTSTYEPGRFQQPAEEDFGPLKAVHFKRDNDRPLKVRFPVGADFNDFDVLAEYEDGFTRKITKKATYSTSEPAATAPVAAVGGRLRGVRPGKTTVNAAFEGQNTKKRPLEVEVVDKVDIDEIRVNPATVMMGQNETVALEAVGYKNGESIGVISGLSNMTWKSSTPEVVQVNGPAITALKLGQAGVSASLAGVTSREAAVRVVDTADLVPPAVDPRVIALRVGEAARIGTDVMVTRAGLDLSRQCAVTPGIPSVVRYVPETHSLVGVSPGVSDVAFAFGGGVANIRVEVGGGVAAPVEQVIVEPASSTLSSGQTLDMRVMVVSPQGHRTDRTDVAVLRSSDATKVRVVGNRVFALAPGTAEITATVPEAADKQGRAAVTVGDEEITDVWVDPPRLDMYVGERTKLRIMGRTANGTAELFAQKDLKISVPDQDRGPIRLEGGNEVHAVAPGQSELSVAWRDRPPQKVAVTVGANVVSDLQIDPVAATLHPGESQTYQVTGLRSGRRAVLGPEDGVRLYTGNQEVAQVLEGRRLTVGAGRPGRTDVTAQWGEQRATASLDVTEGEPRLVAPPDEYVVDGRRYRRRWIPGIGWVRDIYRDGRGWIREGTDIVEPGVVRGEADRLVFLPETLRIAPNAAPTTVRVLAVTRDGQTVREVTDDPALEVGPSTARAASVEKTASGPMIRPLERGEARIGAKLGNLIADPPLYVDVGEGLKRDARLEVAPDPLVLWPDEVGGFGPVRVNPGGGLASVEVEYKIDRIEPGDKVEAVGDKLLRGRSTGSTSVRITAVSPSGAYDGLSTTAMIQVVPAEDLWVEPASQNVPLGGTTARTAVMAKGQGGLPYQVPAALESTDTNVLEPDRDAPGRFLAKAIGGTQIRADYRGRQAFAKVTVSGKLFENVDTTLNDRADDFDMSIRVLAAKSEGALEYRVYAKGQPPDDRAWVRAQPQADGSRVELVGPRMPYGPADAVYQLIIECRDGAGGPVQQYPLSFQLETKRTIKRADSPLDR